MTWLCLVGKWQNYAKQDLVLSHFFEKNFLSSFIITTPVDYIPLESKCSRESENFLCKSSNAVKDTPSLSFFLTREIFLFFKINYSIIINDFPSEEENRPLLLSKSLRYLKFRKYTSIPWLINIHRFILFKLRSRFHFHGLFSSPFSPSLFSYLYSMPKEKL